MKNILFALTTTAALLIAVPSFACGDHAPADDKEKTTASADEACAANENCETCTSCSGEKAKKKDVKKDVKS